ncbi:MAG: nucleoside phosphorylase [Elusimicrobia bacterium]|nr:nucleoside phosphorylase [Elusimicrobiota bacterium]
MNEKYPITGFSREKRALVEPVDFYGKARFSKYCVLCAFDKVLKKLEGSGKLRVSDDRYFRIIKSPVYEFVHGGRRITVGALPVGAPLAAIVLEGYIAGGAASIVACGTAGVLDESVPKGAVILPDSAVRDEGTSYHYLEPQAEAVPHPDSLAAIKRACEKRRTGYTEGRVWTTDAFFRETAGKIKERKRQGCVAVDMEASALFAVAGFRGVKLGQILYGMDSVAGEAWRPRKKEKPLISQEDLFMLAAEACIDI